MAMKDHKCIIIGAPRSGTNMLRDIICSFPDVVTWPCDEINYIWRYGNAKYPYDDFPEHFANEKNKKYISSAFEKMANRHAAKYVVEKTCANTLRVGFINQIFPDAHYIHLVRDGRDSAASALKRWKAPLDVRYILKKAKYVPINDVPYYAMRYLWHRVHKSVSKENRLSTWGPRFPGIDEMLQSHNLLQVCAEQWRQCVYKSESDLKGIDPERVYQLRYEDFVKSPTEYLSQILNHFHVPYIDDQVKKMVSNVSSHNIGKYKKDLSSEEIEQVEIIQKDLLKRYNYLD